MLAKGVNKTLEGPSGMPPYIENFGRIAGYRGLVI
jgi:hypothetical protein